ncbi:MAG: hypothetical protein SOI44_04920 [Lactimicrobium sp.]|uniref:hypothetical protein n=1 Tax=Lactimicrobium sp. TaxID=2563780 RepID=UPI002F354ECE
MMTALLEASKRLLDAVPNVELVTFLFIVFTLFYGPKVIYVAFAFTGLETIYWGPDTWVIMYLYLWPLLIMIVYLTRKHANAWFYSFLSAFFGLIFGALCAIVYIFIGGPSMAFTWWIAGIPSDILHCISNFIVCRLLYTPVMKGLQHIRKQMHK